MALQSLKVLSPFTSLSSLLPSLPLSRWESDGMSFDDFCLLYSELRYQSSVSLGETVRKGWVWSVGSYLWSSVQWLSGMRLEWKIENESMGMRVQEWKIENESMRMRVQEWEYEI